MILLAPAPMLMLPQIKATFSDIIDNDNSNGGKDDNNNDDNPSKVSQLFAYTPNIVQSPVQT
ncbi:hypothetical protein H2248_010121 [Termitomyces sp. 'cryptogamus']|nr:hypothetical protein H2248_010121 [Termitomyces sp. 'cryptogamus']